MFSVALILICCSGKGLGEQYNQKNQKGELDETYL